MFHTNEVPSGTFVPYIRRMKKDIQLIFSLLIIFSLVIGGMIFLEQRKNNLEIQDERMEILNLGSDTSSLENTSPPSLKSPPEEGQALPPMKKEGTNYFAQAQSRDREGKPTLVIFKVDPRIVEDLGFTDEEVRGACEAALERARNWRGEFFLRGTPELRISEGNPTAVIPVFSENPQREMWIYGRVNRKGEFSPLMVKRRPYF